ncbi:MAG: hypothetical protein N3F09_01570 [Bacteroidia bacterium]|nr:hypothetical protein [Bacteroidia bacterium]
MKKIVLIAIVTSILSSCKKDYVCECTVTPGNVKDEWTIKGVSKSRAKANCISTTFEQPSQSGTVTVNSDCKLK